jgi:hypothetical protein
MRFRGRWALEAGKHEMQVSPSEKKKEKDSVGFHLGYM